MEEENADGSFAESRNHGVVGDIEGFTARFISLSEVSKDWSNFKMGTRMMQSISVDQEKVAKPTPGEVALMGMKFMEIFAYIPIFRNDRRLVYWEKGHLVNLLAQEKLQEWMTWLLTSKAAPLTLNAIVFILDIAASISMGAPNRANLRALIASIERGGEICRSKIIASLSNTHFG